MPNEVFVAIPSAVVVATKILLHAVVSKTTTRSNAVGIIIGG
jgi:hypothetical protein